MRGRVQRGREEEEPFSPDPHPQSGRAVAIWDKVFSNCTLQKKSDMLGPCWIWQGSHSGDGRGGGYPRMNLNGQTVAVHRVMFTAMFGYIPGKKQIDHLCRQRMCCNPRHLELVTHKQNQKRRGQANVETR